MSVLQPTAMLADGWATALNVLGPDAALELATKRNIPALFLIRAPDGALHERESPALTALHPASEADTLDPP